MKLTFDLPSSLVRKAKAVAAQQGRPLRDLVAEAIAEKLEIAGGTEIDTMKAGEVRRGAWERWKSRLEQRPDGTWLNPEGIDESFFQSLEEIRREPWTRPDLTEAMNRAVEEVGSDGDEFSRKAARQVLERVEW